MPFALDGSSARFLSFQVDLAGNHLRIGAGTVTSLHLLEAALRAGAGFIVTPTVAEPVIEACVGRGVPVFRGAFSPNEIARVWKLGATIVKVFPAEIPRSGQ
jgi:2-dehydro-3-deoxyphosphogluconate aldolase / (4S)-4-hydroxy-2-oxoglutarate aldolase